MSRPTHVINVTNLTNTLAELNSNKDIISVKLSIGMDTFVKGKNEMWKKPAKERM